MVSHGVSGAIIYDDMSRTATLAFRSQEHERDSWWLLKAQVLRTPTLLEGLTLSWHQLGRLEESLGLRVRYGLCVRFEVLGFCGHD